MAFVADATVDPGFGAGSVVAVAGVYGAFFGADDEGGGISGGELHASRAEIFDFAGGWGDELEVFLRLAEHVDCPTADNTIG